MVADSRDVDRSLLSSRKEIWPVLVDDVTPRRVVEVDDVLGTKEHLGAWTERQALRDSWIAIKNPDVVNAGAPLHDYPQTVDAAIDDASRFTCLNVEQELGSVASSQALSFDSVWNPERIWMLVVSDLC